MKFSVFQTSRRGYREKNEDRMGYCYTRESSLFALADGMGGHPEGEVAAQIALQTFSAIFQRDAQPRLHDVARFLPSALLTAHHQVLRYAADRGMLDTPRTTFVGFVLQDNQAHWVHCGDSRLYIVRDGKLLHKTRDHSYAEHQNATPGSGKVSNRNVLFTCLGSPTKPIFDYNSTALQQGDKILICSDGLWSSVSDGSIVEMLSRQRVDMAVPDLVETALRNAEGYSDNVTVVAIEWEVPDVLGASTRGVSTDDISDGVFASTIQPSWVDNLTDDEFDDDAIERSIAEINEAIRRSAARNHRP